jgi:hypothetical protein
MDATQHQPQQYQPQYGLAVPYNQNLIQLPPRFIPFNKGWHVTKIVFRSLSIAFCIIVIGVATAAAVQPYYYGDNLFVLVVAVPPVCVPSKF